VSAEAGPRSSERGVTREALHARSLSVAAGALCAGLLLASRWSERPHGAPVQLTLGRAALTLALVALALAAASGGALPPLRRAFLFSSGRSTWLALALAGEIAVMLVSIATRGQNTAGALYGYVEVTVVALAATAVLRLRPRLSSVLLACAAGGAAVGCLQALATDDTRSALHGSSGRLTGYYGNPNFLGFAGSLAVPVLLAFALRARGSRSLVWWAALVGVGAAVALSYSRGALLGGAIGVIAVISLRRATLRERLRIALVSGLSFAALAGIGYPLYLRLRTHADFAPVAKAGTPDRSGWDPRAQGLIPAGPSDISNDGARVLRLSASRPGEGASLPLGRLTGGRDYEAAVTLSSPQTVGEQVGIGVEDNLLGAGPASGTALLRPKPRRLRLRWTPARAAANARLYVWLPRGGTALLSGADFGRTATTSRALPLRLLGPTSIGASQAASESRYVRSREDAAGLALELFADNPLTGIGWQRFTAYSARDLHYGQLATHNEYLRFAAELGLPGLVFLLLAAVVVVGAALRAGQGTDAVAATACVATAAVGLVFVNALEVPSIALPLAVSAAVLCVEAGRREVADTPTRATV
jgi:O-antigen ligase